MLLLRLIVVGLWLGICLCPSSPHNPFLPLVFSFKPSYQASTWQVKCHEMVFNVNWCCKKELIILNCGCCLCIESPPHTLQTLKNAPHLICISSFENFDKIIFTFLRKPGLIQQINHIRNVFPSFFFSCLFSVLFFIYVHHKLIVSISWRILDIFSCLPVKTQTLLRSKYIPTAFAMKGNTLGPLWQKHFFNQ